MKTFMTHNMEARRKVRSASPNPAPNGWKAKFIASLAPVILLSVGAAASAQTLYSDDFSTTNARDDAETTADWSGTGQVLLPLAPSSATAPFDELSTVEVLPGNFITRDVELADMDGDGDLDLVEGVFGPNGVYLNDGSGTFGARAYSSPFSTSNTRGLAVGDIDRDGDIDFVAGNRSDRIRLYLNDGTGTNFEIQDVSNRGWKTQSVALADLDNDGFLDLVAAHLDFEQNRVYWNTGDPLVPFGLGGTAGIALSTPAEESRYVLTGDVDRDGDIDLVFLNESEQNQRNRIYLNRLDEGAPRSFIHEEIGTIPVDVDNSHGGALGDLNGDGFLDLVVVNFTGGEASKIYFNNASGVANTNPFTDFGVDFTSPDSPDFAKTASLADADRDGDLDIYFVISGHQFKNRLYSNDGFGNFTYVEVGPDGQGDLPLNPANGPAAVSVDGAVGDINGDGHLDWVLANFESLPSTGALPNMAFSNASDDLGANAPQLRARAVSLTVDASGPASVSLSPVPGVTIPDYASIDFWVSGNGGTNWTPIGADGRPVLIAGGTDIRWRADFRADSPANAALLALNQLDISENASAPVLAGMADETVTEGVGVGPANIVAAATDADGDTIYYSIAGWPDGTGMRIEPSTGQLLGVPSNEDSLASPISATVTATDGAFSDQTSFTLTVTNSNDGPVITTTPPGLLDPGPPATVAATQDELYTYNISATDPDGDPLVFSTLSLPAWLTLTDIGDGTAVLSGTPGAADVFSEANLVELVVTDTANATATQTFEMVIENVNDAPTFTSTEVTEANEGALYTYDITTEDLDNDPVTITAPAKPTWLTFTDNGDGTATLTGTPVAADIGDHSVQLLVDDGTAPAVAQDFTITVANVNDAPIFTSIPIESAAEATAYSYTVTVVDPDLDAVTISAPTLPAWLTFVDNGDNTATLSGMPTGSDVGNHPVQLSADDGLSGVGTQSFTIAVIAAGEGPAITLIGDANVTITEGDTYSDAGATASDPQDGDLTAQIVVDNPVDTSTLGTYTITYTVQDSAGNQAQAQRTVVVQAAPPPPPPPPPPPSGGGGGGSIGIAELALFGLIGFALTARRRRRLANLGIC